ncbi:hypothetical protein [Enterococcus phage EFGrNG]|uniref:Uncharacterized protein n=1 Tax=Enterococcus phage EFGrNG TaxID=2777301 RepID=A0A7S9SW11_9CAUD|nr:hypothetical protein [Enterococcus phage EFGrNG]
MQFAKKFGYEVSRKPVTFDVFKFREGDVVEVIDPMLMIKHYPSDLCSLEDFKDWVVGNGCATTGSDVVSIGRKYVIAEVKYPETEYEIRWNPEGIPDIYVYIDRPDELEKLDVFDKVRCSVSKDVTVSVNYFSLRPVPTKEDLDLNKLSSEDLAKYTELVNEYDKVINARAHQARIEQDILDLFNIPHRNKEEVLDMIKEKMEEE